MVEWEPANGAELLVAGRFHHEPESEKKVRRR